jgi:hypothetical protein
MMKKRIIIICVVISVFIIPMLSYAADWMIFTVKQKDGYTWFYDKNSVVYLKNKTFLFITLPAGDHNFQKMWIKATSDKGNRIFQIELNCKDRTAKLFDNNGKGIYNLPEIDYLYERPIPPDSVLDMLRKAVCR